jgi:hypothetical protein
MDQTWLSPLRQRLAQPRERFVHPLAISRGNYRLARVVGDRCTLSLYGTATSFSS